MGGSPAWNTWVGMLVPRRLRVRYFARRTRICQLGLFGGFLAGGIALQWGAKLGRPLQAFALVFFAAVASRVVSAVYLALQRDAHTVGHEQLSLRVGGLLESLRRDANGTLLAYLLVAQVGVQISAPYFNPYMLGQLKLDYLHYVLLSGAAYGGKILFLPALGWVANRWGTTQLLWGCGILIAPLPAMWLISDNLFYLFGLQVYSGAVWGGFDLAMLLLFFETISAEKRIAILTIYNLANASAIVFGSLVGGLILSLLGTHREAYLLVFLVSSLARGAALMLLVRMPQVRVAAVPIPTRSLALRPALGSVDRPILAGMDHGSPRRFRLDAAQSLAQPTLVQTKEQRWELTFGGAGGEPPQETAPIKGEEKRG